MRVYEKVGKIWKSRKMSPSSLALLVMEETAVLSYMVVDLVVLLWIRTRIGFIRTGIMVGLK